MPPAIKPVTTPGPDDRSLTVLPFLETSNLSATTPPVRSSDWELSGDPFLYYLTRRLSLATALSMSAVMSSGSWAHERFALWVLGTQPGDSGISAYETLVKDRIEEIKKTTSALFVHPDVTEKLVTREREHAAMGRMLFELALVIPDGEGRTMIQRISPSSGWVDLGAELCVEAELLTYNGKKINGLAQFDRLLYNPNRKQLWVLDLKTTGMRPKYRLLQCPVEFQTALYTHIADLARPRLIKIHKLDPETTIGGMIHVAVQRPNLKLSDQDRNYTLEERTITKGARKDQTEEVKRYVGHLVFENYMKRCRSWMLGTEHYSNLLPDRRSEPCVAWSFTHFPRLQSSHHWTSHEARLTILADLATRPPAPENFPPRASTMITRGEPSIWAPFYTRPIGEWPAIMAENRLAVLPRTSRFDPFRANDPLDS